MHKEIPFSDLETWAEALVELSRIASKINMFEVSWNEESPAMKLITEIAEDYNRALVFIVQAAVLAGGIEGSGADTLRRQLGGQKISSPTRKIIVESFTEIRSKILSLIRIIGEKTD